MAASGTFSEQFPGYSEVQIPFTFSHHGNQPEYNLSSHCQDQNCVMGSPTEGYKAFSGTTGFANLMPPVSLGITIPSSDRRLLQQYWGQSSPSIQSTSPEPSSAMYSPSEFTRANSMEPPSPAQRHVAPNVSYGALPVVRAAVPEVPSQEAPSEEPCPEETGQWQREWEEWLQLEGPPSFNARLQWQKWNRVLHIPRSLMGRKLPAGWENDNQTNNNRIEDFEGRKSMHSGQTVPSIL